MCNDSKRSYRVRGIKMGEDKQDEKEAAGEDEIIESGDEDDDDEDDEDVVPEDFEPEADKD